MRKVVVVDGDILTPLGDLDETWQNLTEVKTGVMFHRVGNLELPLGAIANLSGEYGSWSRLESMFDRLLSRLPELPEKTMLFCATTKGAVDELLLAPHSSQGQPWQVGDYLADRVGFPEPGEMVSAACASGLIAVIQAAMNIGAGRCDHGLIIGFDLLADFVVSGFESLKALSHENAKPFDKKRKGLNLGDGAGWMLLSAEDTVHSFSPKAYLENWAVTCDATHITAPCRYASGLKAALTPLTSGSVATGGIIAHGTGTIYNDAMELLAFDDTFDTKLPVCSVKGALGHSLAAAGLVETVLAIKSLEKMVVPPTYGLETAEESRSLLSGDNVLPLAHPAILTCNSGFGGINAALLLTG